jgi:phosphate transport system protein
MTGQMSGHQHISGQFERELADIKSDLLEMGGLVEQQIDLAAEALVQSDSELAEAAITLDAEVNDMEIKINEQCTKIIARRQPTASDLRLIMAIVKLSLDLERIGDEASKVARQVLMLAADGLPNPTLRHLRPIASHVTTMLNSALDGFARMDVNGAMNVILSDDDINEDYAGVLSDLLAYIREDPEHAESYLGYMWAFRSLERVGDHACNIAEQVIYLARGIDVRHQSSSELRKLLA